MNFIFNIIIFVLNLLLNIVYAGRLGYHHYNNLSPFFYLISYVD